LASLEKLFLHKLLSGTSSGGWTQTLNLGMMRRVFYYNAAALAKFTKPTWILIILSQLISLYFIGSGSTVVEHLVLNPKIKGSKSHCWHWEAENDKNACLGS
jgi:hypothetical protein